jgi:precorrin-3B C17-methyltransferase
MTKRALDVLSCVETIVGYTTYIDLIRPLIKDQEIISTGMKKEIDRVQAAIDISCKGKSCAIISSGDPGIYAMAGLVFEMCEKNKISILKPASNSKNGKKKELVVEVVPGVPSLSSGASLLGAPLAHDFAVISLSDLLTPWDMIAKRLHAAAKADFVIVLYNPKSRKRDWQLAKALEIILEFRDKKTPAGIVTGAMRSNQKVLVTTLGNIRPDNVDMQTTVFIGSSASRAYLDFIITPRGYSKKYSI